MGRRLVRVVDSFELTPAHLETLAYLHGAIDPDSGHIICHGYSIHVTALDVNGRPVPAVFVDECFGYTAGQSNIEALVEGAEEVSEVRVEKGRLLIGGVSVNPSWGFYALGYSKEAMEAPRMYKVVVEDSRGSRETIVIVYTAPEHQAFILPECSEQRERHEMHV